MTLSELTKSPNDGIILLTLRENEMLITRKSPFTGKTHTREIPVTEEQLSAWRLGEFIKTAMPNISAEDREFIKTGITPEEWNETFGDA